MKSNPWSNPWLEQVLGVKGNDDLLQSHPQGEDVIYWKYWAPMGWKAGLRSGKRGQLYVLQCNYCDGIINVQPVNADHNKIFKYQQELTAAHHKKCEELHARA